MLALKKSNAFVLLCGIVLMAVGLIATPFCSQMWSLLIFFGILLPAGTGALCFGIVMGALSPIIGDKRAVIVSGIVQASAGIGDALMSPAAFWLGYKKRKIENTANIDVRKESGETEKLTVILRSAFREKTYWCLLIGFSACGFHMSIIETHLYSQYISAGIPNSLASLTLTVYGIFTMLGAVTTGFLGQKMRMKNVLGGVYAIRVLIAVSFLLLPKSVLFAFITTGLLGMTGDSTVPPTTGIISNKVGVAKMAVVYGSIFIGHQTGAFFSAFLGGLLVDTTLGYSGLWIFDLILSFIAAAVSFKTLPLFRFCFCLKSPLVLLVAYALPVLIIELATPHLSVPCR